MRKSIACAIVVTIAATISNIDSSTAGPLPVNTAISAAATTDVLHVRYYGRWGVGYYGRWGGGYYGHWGSYYPSYYPSAYYYPRTYYYPRYYYPGYAYGPYYRPYGYYGYRSYGYFGRYRHWW